MDETPMSLLPVHVYSPRSDAVTSLMFNMVRYGKAPLMVAVVIWKEMISTCVLDGKYIDFTQENKKAFQ